ncbi:hypothetical protein [Streptomyces liliifuscus]|uniref:Uncharacterized protein n=1 Tax=Streptomyces liliifuscus TaxID=2797636 RepID=A0A7T7L173_9ACTN|nr:hypothetical protein [Streptomyces liliifuscus]QQM44571.1 hypothetical protein JEQ17_37650 [Streptomyces liliifuscus]
MGNFSRNTFRPEKSYVGVRLQQGVPLVDADWNEQNDVIRQEVYDGLAAVGRDGVARLPGSADHSFRLWPTNTANNFFFLAGPAIVAGRPVRIQPRWLDYGSQPWTDPAKAAKDGVAVLPALTTPAAARSDLVYLDVWEREVGQAEDGEIVNPVIGVETAVRLKREFTVRVVEGGTALPGAPGGHFFTPLGVLNRAAGGAVIQVGEIEERRPFLDVGPATRYMSLSPVFPAITGNPAWEVGSSGPKLFARKPAGVSAVGILPLRLPQRARLGTLAYQAVVPSGSGSLLILLGRSSLDPADTTSLYLTGDSIGTSANTPIRRSMTVAREQNAHLVDNTAYSYHLYAWGGGTGELQLHGLLLDFES